MPDLLTPQALATAGPLVLETLFKHFLVPKSAKGDAPAREDLMYDEAFVLMKTFLEIATKHPVAALQRFGLVRTPAPPWVALHRVLIPQSTLATSAEYLITALGGEEMAYKIAGGTKWWQVRAGNGVEGEWIVMKKDWKEHVKQENGRKQNKEGRREPKKSRGTSMHADDGMVGDDGGVEDNGEFRKEMDELRCMLYIHGGAYYWGSINTHRYTIWRYARKMQGRCFAVNYRKAPQYPFPCAIHDCLAAYLYLVNPPPEARHKPVDPKNIILAGDSAGGGLVWALLQILRDTEGLELPAGAVLISPWSDLTHSFPSILSNTATDIVPPYGFIHKPSSLWPPPPPALTDEIQDTLRTRVREAVSRLKGGDYHHHHPQSIGKKVPDAPVVKEPTDTPHMRTSSPQDGAPGGDKPEKSDLYPLTEKGNENSQPGPTGDSGLPTHKANPGLAFGDLKSREEATSTRETTLTLCDAPMKLQVKDETVLIDTQIQLYATNAQLCHPWVSPVLGYLGGLPPIFVMAGDKEVLRDEIIYAAHKAANPDAYPIRDDVRAMLPSLNGIEERFGPTNVHLQVYDGACHDLPLFSMTKVSRGLFRAIASFARYVTPLAPGSLSISKSQINTPSGSGSRTPVTTQLTPSDGTSHVVKAPGSETPPFVTPTSSLSDPTAAPTLDMSKLSMHSFTDETSRMVASPSQMSSSSSKKNKLPCKIARLASSSAKDDNGADGSRLPRSVPQGPEPSGDDAGPRFSDEPADTDSRARPGEAGYTGIYRGDNPYTNHMIRERVATDGSCRPLEPPEELQGMKMPRDEVGMIKEGPAIRYLNGQSLWDKKFKHAIKTVARHRKKNLQHAHEKDTGKISRMWDDKIKSRKQERERMAMTGEVQEAKDIVGEASGTEDEGGLSETEGELETDVEDERGYYGRHRGTDKPQTVEEDMLNQSWSWSWALDGEAPPPSAIVSRRDFASHPLYEQPTSSADLQSEARQMALMADRMDTAHDSSVHGLSIWVGLATFFSSSSERNNAHEALRKVHEVQQAERAERGTLPGESAVGRGSVEMVEKGLGKVGRMFGIGKK